jgi:MOSC domain-containing protein YiiM
MAAPSIHAIFVGKPKTITDEYGPWVSSICRESVSGPIAVLERGLIGDAVAQPYHGSPDAAICAHLLDHYTFWNTHYGMDLAPGAVGENITVNGITDDQVCAGDIVAAGTAILQVSGPRIPCANLARRIGRPDWVRLTLAENRTGFYLRVLQPGTIERGDVWQLRERPAPDAAIPSINRCMFLEFDLDYAHRMQEMRGLADWWKEQAREKCETNGLPTRKGVAR